MTPALLWPLVIGACLLVLAVALFLAWYPSREYPNSPIRLRGLFRGLNAFGRFYRRLTGRPLFRLDPGRLEPQLVALKQAEHRLYGSPDTPSEFNALRALLRGYESAQAPTSTVGRLYIQRSLRRGLRHRQQVLAYARAHPGVLDVPINRPLIITGLPRSGTTFLQRLLANDSRSRAPVVWLLRSDPAPRPPTQAEIRAGSDPRLRALEKRLLKGTLLSPDKEVLRRMSHASEFTDVDEESLLLEECLWTNTGATAVGDDEAYAQWVLDPAQDKRYMYRYLKVWLQVQSSVYPPESHWLLKTPAHTFFLPTLEAEFPDANLVFIHRDPCAVVASACRYILIAFIITMDYARVRPDRHGVRVLAALAAEAQRICVFARSGSAAARRAVHLRYEDVIADPLGTAQRLYAHFGYTWTRDFESGIHAYLESNPQYKHGRPDYSLQAFGLDEAAVERAFADYNHLFRSGQAPPDAWPASEPATTLSQR